MAGKQPTSITLERVPSLPEALLQGVPVVVREHIRFLERQNAFLIEKYKEHEARIQELEKQLSKNSTNSHKPPSSDGPAKPPRTQSERKPSGKKPGGQTGHSGSTLRKSLNPEHRIRHSVDCCADCKRDLSNQKPDWIVDRQVFDLPPVQIECTAHEAEVKRCAGCGKRNQAAWPAELGADSASVVYGPNLRTLCTYLLHGQLLPYARTAEIIEDLTGHRLSTGTLNEWTTKASAALESADQAIADALAADLSAVHFDETGAQVEKRRMWLHSASNEKLTHFMIHEKRGTEAIEAMGILPRFKGVAVHDRWGPYFGYDCRHGLCGSHLLRDLRFILEQEKEAWAGKMRECLKAMNDAVHEAKERGRIRFNGGKLRRFKRRYRRIVNEGLRLHRNKDASDGSLARSGSRGRKKQRPGKNLLDALHTHEDWVLLFLHDFTVPFTNNQGERDIRMSKVKLKISGCFRSMDGARHFCRIRGYLSTARKQGWSLLEAMRSVFLGNPLLPGFA